ncbi:hypothetical protein A0H81_07816 [Grifola frondosa]|uniref:Uncharacterized protein n=1 Tax=Grifola frondosa TaxID=5627 RepID=A0A1C7M6F5_GRIFR|nr:hypothetical protein A0H81_07816 [Grifola frondosa]
MFGEKVRLITVAKLNGLCSVSSVVSSKQLARRWRDYNPKSPPLYASGEDEDEWRIGILELLSAAHTLGGIVDLSFEVVDSRYSDFAIELGSDSFKWRWESFALGPKVSADLLSKQLIMPLISVTHLAFSSADAVSELSEANLEKAVDKVGRTARRTIDTHIKNAISKPRIASTLRRMTAMFNFSTDLPAIFSDAVAPDLTLPSPPVGESRTQPQPQYRTASSSKSPDPAETRPTTHSLKEGAPKKTVDVDSVTEEEDSPPPPDSVPNKTNNLQDTNTRSLSPVIQGTSKRASPASSPRPMVGPSRTPNEPLAQAPTSDSSPPRPIKKAKHVPVASSSDEDSEEERKRHLAQIKNGARRGTKQPLKRGGRRF